MDRRDFVKTILASTGAVMVGAEFFCTPAETAFSIFPKGNMPKKLWAIDIIGDLDWHHKVFLSCFQGLVNKKQNRIYHIQTSQDRFWLDYYRDYFGIDVEKVSDIDRALKMFVNEISGYISYDPHMPHSLNLATAIGSLNDAVPISKNLERYAIELGLKKADDLSGRWKDLYHAYEWALDNIQPQCNQQIMAQLCVHDPHWPTSTFKNRDYIIAHNILPIDISSSERDKRDYRLLQRFYEAYPEGAIIIGWHCVRDKEHEAIALSSEYGHYGICTLNTSNLTVHSGIKLKSGVTHKQRSLKKQDLQVEDKVYIAYMATDGDAAWFVQNHVMKDWANPLHGQFKYNWGFLPMAYDMMPAMVQYYFENMSPNDYFVAGPAGATYTYPHLHPHPRDFLRLSKYYMEKCGLTTVHMTNWNDRDWWQEVDLPEFHDLLRNNLPNCVGYVRGMGESAFEEHFISGGKPYIFCGEGIHRGSDIYQTMKDFIDACPNRPLFIYNLVNHNIPMDHIKKAMDRFPADTIELVHLDELLILIEKAFEEGKITEDLYPEKGGLQKIMAKEAREAWPAFFQEMADFKTQFSSGEEGFIESIRKMPIGLENIIAGDMLAFISIWHGMKLVKLALESKGIYVNHKPTATKNFMREFNHISDIQIIMELQKLWDNWHQQTIEYDDAEKYAIRLLKISERINQQHLSEEIHEKIN